MKNHPAHVTRFPARASTQGLLPGLLLAIAIASPATATQEYILPTLFDVSGVAARDVLNIREDPGGHAAIIGTLAPDARGIEVVGHDRSGQWARINTGERSGWVALRFLSYRIDVWNPGQLPPTLHCLGTEPFWSLRPDAEDGLVLARPEAPETPLRIGQVLDSGLFRDPRRAVTAMGEDLSLSAVILPLACSDGMSDRSYGLDVTVILGSGGAAQMLTGCCSIAP